MPVFSWIRAALLLVALLLFGAGGTVRADITVLQDPPLGAADAWSVALGGIGLTLDSGLVGGARNPAAYTTDRNELMAEIGVMGSLPLQSGLEAPEPIVGPGALAYLASIGRYTISFQYLPAQRYQVGYLHGGVQEVQVVRRTTFSEYGGALAVAVREEMTLGIRVHTLRGSAHEGVLADADDLDTIWEPALWGAEIGVKGGSGLLRWGVVAMAPEYGTVNQERPVQVGNRRTDTRHDWRGPWGVRAGLGMPWPATGGLEVELEYRRAGFAQRNGEQLYDEASLVSGGLSHRQSLSDQIALATGVRYRFVDPAERPFLVVGLGGEYSWERDWTFFAGGGMVLPVGEEHAGTPLEDVRPWTLRAGVRFHGR